LSTRGPGVTLPAGTKLGPNEILSQLGAGGMGAGYKARHSKLNREVAGKILPADTPTDPAAQVRFAPEARAVAPLSHQTIHTIHDCGPLDRRHSAVQRLLPREAPQQRSQRGALPKRRGPATARRNAMGLAPARDRETIHRDLKPENLFLTKDGSVKI